MHFVTHLTIALISLVTIVFSCILFTNAIEFLGNKLKLGNNATGSILAVIGTGLPEFIVPFVAIFGVKYSGMELEIANDIALGAILGSPFMLSTLALFLLLFVLLIQKRKEIDIDVDFVLRDCKYILIAYLIAIIFSFDFLDKYKAFAPIALLLLYVVFVYRTVVKSRCTCIECECEKIYLRLKNENFALFFQFFVSLLGLVTASHYFVNEIKYFSLYSGVAPSILALLIVPFATELPECINSIIWIKQKKDDLALANILGAIVFQTTLLFAIGMLLTSWDINNLILLNLILTIFSCLVFFLLVALSKKIKASFLTFLGIIYFIFLTILLIK